MLLSQYYSITFVLQAASSPSVNTVGGKSGQHRATRHLTGGRFGSNVRVMDSATENVPG
jgi:hypothetical protein